MFKFEPKDFRVWVYDCNHKYIKTLVSIKKASEAFNIPYPTLCGYIKSGKLYNNKFYFYKIKPKSNQDFDSKNNG
jgi:hypothetical protein